MKILASKFTWMLVLAFAAITLAVFALAQEETTEAPPVAISVLTRHDLVNAEGMEAVVLLAVFQPGAAMAEGEELAHTAEEFVYVLEGSAKMTREGEEPIIFTEGDAWYNDLGLEHKLQNASNSELLKVIAIWIGEKGKVWPSE